MKKSEIRIFNRLLSEYIYMDKLKPGDTLPADFIYMPYLDKAHWFKKLSPLVDVQENKFIISHNTDAMKDMIYNDLYYNELVAPLYLNYYSRFRKKYVQTISDFFTDFMEIPNTPILIFANSHTKLKQEFSVAEINLYNLCSNIINKNIINLLLELLAHEIRLGEYITPWLRAGIPKYVPIIHYPNFVRRDSDGFYLLDDYDELMQNIKLFIFSKIRFYDSSIYREYLQRLRSKYQKQ